MVQKEVGKAYNVNVVKGISEQNKVLFNCDYHRSQKGGLSWGVSENTHADFREFCEIHVNFAKFTKIRVGVFAFSLRSKARKIG